MKYLGENDCDCGQYFERSKFSSSLHEHDFPHTQNNGRNAAKQKRAEGTSATEKGIVH